MTKATDNRMNKLSEDDKLSKEWNYSRNKGINPEDVSLGSSKKVWWICSKGHEWQATPKNRRHGTGCPYCTGKIPAIGENDLASMFPLLAKEWNYEKNNGLKPEDITYGSSKKVWWICSKGHEWQATPAHRVGGRGCPICHNERSTSFPEQVILYYVKKLFPDAISRYKPLWLKTKYAFSEIDVYIPSHKIGVEYDGQAFHKDVERDEKKDRQVAAHGITLYRLREPMLPQLITESICIRIVSTKGRFYYQEAISQLLKSLSEQSNIPLTFTIDIKRDYSSILESYKKRESENSIAIKAPILLGEWNYSRNIGIDPSTISYGSSHLIWWRCRKCGNEWQATPKHRTGGEGCPKCGKKSGAKQRIKERLNKGISISFEQWCLQNGSIGDTLLHEWSGDNNTTPSEHTYSSNVKVLWECPNGHKYSATIGNRTSNGTSCPYCASKATLRGYNDLATTHSNLLAEWDYTKNEILPSEIRAGSNKKVWWKCENGHSYQAVVYNKTTCNTKCPYCTNTKVLKGYNDLESKYPALMEEWDYKKNTVLPSEVLYGTGKKVYWKCKECGFEWNTAISYRTNGSGCPRCAKSKAGKIARQNAKKKNS